MRLKPNLLTYLLIWCLVNIACSQTAPTQNISGTSVFQGSTPGDGLIKSLLTIQDNIKVDFIRWKLSLNAGTTGQHSFSLDIVFGEAQQNTLGFQGGGQKLSFTGEYTVSMNKDANYTGEIYHLKSSRLPKEILLRKLNDNLLHLLKTQNELMNGNAGYSYTLNRVNPVIPSSYGFTSQSTGSSSAGSSLDTVNAFHGRTHCNPELIKLNGVADAGYQRIKWELTLYYDPQTQMPTTFQHRSIYVGVVDAVATKTGRWEITKGMKTDSQAIVYLLRLDAGGSLALLRGDDNVLFFLDKDRNLMVGNEDHSYTLNRKSK